MILFFTAHLTVGRQGTAKIAQSDAVSLSNRAAKILCFNTVVVETNLQGRFLCVSPRDFSAALCG